jgi:hypothetical protein
MLGFTLSMPNTGSWNGRWTGEKNLHYLSRRLSKDKEAALDGKSFHYDFGDGWCAGISCKKVDAKTNAKMNKLSSGFCMYDWMVDSIVEFGKILNSNQRQDKIPAANTERQSVGVVAK